VLLSTPLHASSNFTVSVQLANKRGLKKIIIALERPESRLVRLQNIEPRFNLLYQHLLLKTARCDDKFNGLMSLLKAVLTAVIPLMFTGINRVKHSKKNSII
jgi:hypothetical protein